MKTSVIITTYNRPDALKRVLDGLYRQTCPPHEIIVADDGSTNETRDMLGPYTGRKKTPLFHVWQQDLGFRAARIRNRAILKSTGDYLILLDGDCIPGPHFIADHLALARPGHFFQGKRVLVNPKLAGHFDREDIASFFRLVRHALSNGISNRHHIFRVPFFPGYRVDGLSGVRSCNMGIFREDLSAVNGFNQDFVGWGREDSELVVRLYNLGIRRREHPFMAICYHLWHPENSRSRISINDGLLQDRIRSRQVWCKNGMVTQENPRQVNPFAPCPRVEPGAGEQGW